MLTYIFGCDPTTTTHEKMGVLIYITRADVEKGLVPVGEVQTGAIRLDFPVFPEEDPLEWSYKVQQFFSFYNTLPQSRLWLASFYMEDQALFWFQDIDESGQLRDRDQYVEHLSIRYDLTYYDDRMEALTRLRQTGSV